MRMKTIERSMHRIRHMLFRQICITCSNAREMTSSSNGLSVSINKDIAIIHMKRGDNRLNIEFFNAFHRCLDQIESDAAIRGLITTGHGKFYNNGLDLEWMKTLSSGQFVNFMNDLKSFNQRILLFPLPSLAAINGHAIAGGAVMAYSHDLRVMNEEKGWIFLNNINPDKQIFHFLSSLLRNKVSTEKTFTNEMVFGQRLSAQQALELGLVDVKTSQCEVLENSINILQQHINTVGLDRASLKKLKEDNYVKYLLPYDDDQVNRQDFTKQFMTDSQRKTLENDM